MIDAAVSARDFIAGRTRDDLDTLLFGLVKAIEIIGEAASRVSEPTRTASPEIPWALTVAMRNRLIHAYFDVDHEVVWKTVTEELPQLLPALQALLAVP